MKTIFLSLLTAKVLRFHILGERESFVGDTITVFPPEQFHLVIREIQTMSLSRDLIYEIWEVYQKYDLFLQILRGQVGSRSPWILFCIGLTG